MNEALRRDPDAIIERIRQEEERASRGRLRIYFGSSAGVGKTYAMLLAARALKSAGTDVVAGVIETHGRVDTATQMAEGLARLLLQDCLTGLMAFWHASIPPAPP